MPPKERPSSAMQRVIALEKALKASRKDWKTPSPAFTNKEARLPGPKKAAPDNYNVDAADCMAADVSKTPSAWAKDKSPKDCKTRKVTCEKQYNPDVDSTAAVANKGKCLPAFRDTTERFPDPKTASNAGPGEYLPDTFCMGGL